MSNSFRDTEVEHLDRAVGSHFDVRGLQIAVHDAAFVRRVERVGNLPRDLQRFGQRQTARLEPNALRRWSSVSPSTSSMTSACAAARCLEAVQRCDVRMVQRGEKPRFTLEALQATPDRGERASGSTLSATSRCNRASRAR